MKSKECIELLKNMLEIYSPSGKEMKLAFFLEDRLEKLGLKNVRRDKVGNVYGEVGSGSPTVLLCGHMDTVPGWIPVRLENDMLYGRGAVDAKSSLAAMISAAAKLKVRGEGGKVVAAGVVEEERKAKGIRQLLRESIDANYAIFGEPSGLSNITFAYKGKLGIKLTCSTETGHVGAQHLYFNAIEKAYDLWISMFKSFTKERSPHGEFYSATPCLIGIRSRRSYGGTPNHCVLRIDIRLPPKFRCDEATAIVKRTVDQFQRENPKVSVKLEVKDKVDPFVADRNTILMKALKESIEEVSRIPVRFLRKTGTGDMNIFGSKTGIPVATYGPGDSRLSHTHTEYINTEEYLTSIEVYRKTLEKLFAWKNIS